MISHPKFTDTNSGLDQIPVYSDHNDLYLYARAIQDYIGVQRIEGRMHHKKQISQLFLKYFNKPLYQKAKILMQTRLESCNCNNLPISLQVPGLATMITQQTLELGDEKLTNLKHYDNVTKLSSITLDIMPTSTNSFDQITATISSQTTKFKGNCKACG